VTSEAPGASGARHVLLVAYHFPPIQASSGVHRTLAFARYLPRLGWNTSVLTVHQRAYIRTREANGDLVPAGVEVIRASAWDTVRHLSVGERYLRVMALPDRWQSWILPAFAAGLAAIRRNRSDAVFSTFPIASAHLVGWLLHRASGRPWIADFRDPMLQDTYPADPWVRRSWDWIERRVFRDAARVVVTTPGAARFYRSRYGSTAAGKLRVIANGYDPESFPAGFRPGSVTSSPRDVPGRRLTLLHSGILYPNERNPEPFLRAIARLSTGPTAAFPELRVVFRSSGHDARYADLVRALGLDSIVSFRPPIAYREALNEMLAADALMVFQASNCNDQIPAKAYEYLYTGRPVMGFTDPSGDTGRLLREHGVPLIVELDDSDAIERALRIALPLLHAGSYAVPDRAAVQALSREARTAELAGVLAEVTPGAAPTAVTRPA
jgi:glycosyltransferase involved in cell wall biosynthesis